MKVIKSNLKLTITAVSFSLFGILGYHSIKTSKQENIAKSTLYYSIMEPRAPITLDLFEAEKYEPAIVVQQLIGNLVYYSNHGRYEPRIAEAWTKVSENQWRFKLKRGFICENGEKITPVSFKKSLMRSFKISDKKGGVPVFDKLIGFKEFADNKNHDLPGLSAEGDTLSFHFSEPTRSGPLQLLSFAQYGYICEENLNADHSWRNKSKFISSGPYKVENVEIGKQYILTKRHDWPDFSPNSPDKVIITHEIPSEKEKHRNLILDTRKPIEHVPDSLKRFALVPEYLNTILLGNLNKGFFGSIDNRHALDEAIQKVRSQFAGKWPNQKQSSFFYPSQQLNKRPSPSFKWNKPNVPLVIEGSAPDSNIPRLLAWNILRSALDLLDWKYAFKNNPQTWADVTNPNHDIRIRNPSIGGGVEAWGLNILFFSPMGIQMPDPSGRVKNMLTKFEHGGISEQELTDSFLQVVEEDAAIIPISHFGVEWFISDTINARSISPLISIIRFDKTEINE